MTEIPTALDDLLAKWHKTRAPALADAIERLAAVAPRAAAAATQDDWIARLAKVEPSDAGELAALISPAPAALKAKQLGDTIERLRALRRLLPDPRIARALFDFARAVPFTSNSSEPMWLQLFDTLVEAGDPRAHTWLDGIFAGKQIREAMRVWLEKTVAATQARFAVEVPAEIALDDNSAAAVAALVERLAPVAEEPAAVKAERRAAATTQKTRDELLAAVYAAPDDDGPRLVLADVLLEAGDPWGEFISLQCARPLDNKPSARERELLKAHGREWLGELARFVQLSGDGAPTFRRGFPAVVAIKYKSKQDPDFARDLPAWATVEELELGYGGQLIPQAMRALRRLTGLDVRGLRSLLELAHLRPTGLHFLSNLDDYALWHAFETSPIAERLDSVGNVPLEYVARSPLLPQLREVAFSSREKITDAHLALAVANPSLRLRLTIHGGCDLTIARDAEGLIGATLRPSMHTLGWLADELKGIGVGTIQSLSVALDDDRPVLRPDELRATVEGWMGTLEALRTFDLTAVGGARGTRSPTRTTVTLATPSSLLADVRRVDWTRAGLVVTQRRGVTLLDPSTGETRASHLRSDEHVSIVRPDGVLVTSGLLDARTGHSRPLPETKRSLWLATRDGRHAWTFDNELVNLDAGTVGKLPKTKGQVYAVDDACARCVASFGEALWLYLIDGSPRPKPRELCKSQSVRAMWFSADGERLLVVDHRSQLSGLSLSDGATLFSVGGSGGFEDAALGDDCVLIGGWGGAALYDDHGGAIRWERPFEQVHDVALSADGSRVFVATAEALTAYSSDGDRELWSLPIKHA